MYKPDLAQSGLGILILECPEVLFCLVLSLLQVVLDIGMVTELSVNMSVPLSNITFRLCAYTGAGYGPWTPVQTLSLVPTGARHGVREWLKE